MRERILYSMRCLILSQWSEWSVARGCDVVKFALDVVARAMLFWITWSLLI